MSQLFGLTPNDRFGLNKCPDVVWRISSPNCADGICTIDISVCSLPSMAIIKVATCAGRHLIIYIHAREAREKSVARLI